MAEFQKGNRFWEQRSKNGREMLFSSPTLLWEACTEYFEWCESNPLPCEEVSAGRIVETKKLRPFTIQGLCLYLDCNTQYINQLERTLADKTDEVSADFSIIIKRVREIIYNQKFTGAASGFFNANIIARDLGLTDKQDVTTAGNEIKQIFKIGGTEIEF